MPTGWHRWYPNRKAWHGTMSNFHEPQAKFQSKFSQRLEATDTPSKFFWFERFMSSVANLQIPIAVTRGRSGKSVGLTSNAPRMSSRNPIRVLEDRYVKESG